MANEVTLSAITGLVEDISAEVIFQLNATAGILDCVTHRDTEGTPGDTLDFPKYSAHTSSDVATVAEGTDVSTNVAVTNTDIAAKVADKVIMATITDAAVRAQRPSVLVDDITAIFLDAVKAKLEDDIVSLFTAFSQTVAGAATTMTLQHWYDSLRQVRAGSGMGELCAVLSPKQYYGAKGLQPLLFASNLPGSELATDMQRKGFIPNPFGCKALVSNEIDEDVGSGGDAAGAIFAKSAIGLHTKGLFNVEIERDASLRAFQLVGVGLWKAVELQDAHGVYFLSDVA